MESPEVRQVVVLIVKLHFLTHSVAAQQTKGILKTSVDVVTKLVSQVHAGAHCWTLGLYIPEEGHRKVEGGEGFFYTFYAKHRAQF